MGRRMEYTITSESSNSFQSRVGRGPSSFIFFNIYIFLRDRETEHKRRRGRGREGDTESEAGSRLRAISTEPDAGLRPTSREIMT